MATLVLLYVIVVFFDRCIVYYIDMSIMVHEVDLYVYQRYVRIGT